MTKSDLIHQYARWGHAGPVVLFLLLARLYISHHYEHAYSSSIEESPENLIWFRAWGQKPLVLLSSHVTQSTYSEKSHTYSRNCFMWNPKVHYHIHMSPRPIHLNAAHTFLSWFFNFILPSTLRSFKRSRLVFWLKFLCIISDGFDAHCIFHHSYAPRFDHLSAVDYFCVVYLLKIRLQGLKVLVT